MAGNTTTLDTLAASISAAWSPPFRGQIYEYAKKLALQDGYAVKGELDILTLRHLVQPLRAIRNSRVRLVSIRGAVQTTKSLCADITVPNWIENDPGDCLWLLEDEPKARDYAKRAMPLIRSVPEIAALLQDVDRNDKTQTELSFRHMKLKICGLNAGNVQSLSWRYVIVDEAWLHPFDGLIRQAMDRTKQYPDTKKIILLAQGGVEEDDHDREHQETDQRELHFACPHCGRYQIFELSRERGSDPSSAVSEQIPAKYAGLAWDTNEVTRPAGKWDFEAVGRSAHHVCYFCGGRIEDTPEMRRRLNDSYAFFPRGTSEQAKEEFRKKRADLAARSDLAGMALVNAIEERCEQLFPFGEKVGFWWPGEASMRVSFSYLAQKYLRAKIAAEEQSYRLPLQEYYQKDRGLPWSDTTEADYKIVTHEPYDVLSDWKDEAYRVVVGDCQKDLKLIYWQVFAIALSGETRELARGKASGFGLPPGKDGKFTPAALSESDTVAAVQRTWKVKDQHVFLDCGYEMTKVLRECVQHGHVASVKVGGKVRKLWRCWTGLKGSGQELFTIVHPKTGVKEYRIFSERKWYNTNVGTADRQPRAPWYEWSNLHVKDLLRARRDGEASAPKFCTLPDMLPATDRNSFFAMMRSERRIEIYTGGKKRAIWVPIKDTWPNHYWDTGCECIVFQAIVGIIGGEMSADGDRFEDQAAAVTHQ